MRPDNKFSRLRWLAVMAVLAMVAAACGGSPSGTSSEAGGSEAGGSEVGGSEPAGSEPAGSEQAGGEATETMVFGTSADPVILDGALVSDGESLRALDQMFEGLVTLAPGGTEVVPGLATDWEISDNGQSYTFTLQEGVTFHDGEPFNADAVCFNFDRWYNFEGSFQNPAATYYWQTVFGGFAETDPDSGAPEDSLFDSCEATSDTEVTINLTKPSASFLPAMALTNFTIASPAALEEFNADEGRVNAEGIFNASGTYGTEHPTGTGPFMFSEWIRGDRLVMERNPDYWGDAPGNIGTLIFRPTDPAAQLQALQTGEINGYDLVSPEDFETIESDDQFQLLTRPAFNIGYVGINQAVKPLDDIEVRKALAHAINRQEVVTGFYGGQGVVAKEFMPPEVFGYAEDVTEYAYDPEMSRQILTDAGYDLPVQIDFAYPTDVSRPYMPDPQANFEAMVADLNEAGFEVQTKSAIWSPDYLDNVSAGRYGLYLLGWTGDFGDPDNFIGTFFQSQQKAWGFENQEIFDKLDEAEVETNEERRIELYQEANRLIMDFLPGIPYVHTEPALAFTANVTGYQTSPVSLEPFSIVTIEGGQ